MAERLKIASNGVGSSNTEGNSTKLGPSQNGKLIQDSPILCWELHPELRIQVPTDRNPVWRFDPDKKKILPRQA